MAEDRPVSTANTEYATPPPSLPPPLPVVDSAPLEVPLDVSLDVPLEPPRASFLAPGPSIASSPRDSRADSASGPENEKEGFTPGHSTTVLPVGRPEAEDAEAPPSQPHAGSGNGPSNGNSTSPKNPSNAITGGDGSTVTSGNTTFVYKNPFGGFCEFLFFYTNPFTYVGARRAPHDVSPFMGAVYSARPCILVLRGRLWA